MQSGGQFKGSAIGRLTSRTAEALRRTQHAAASGVKRTCKWIVNTCGNLFGDPANDPQRAITTLKTPPEPAAG